MMDAVGPAVHHSADTYRPRFSSVQALKGSPAVGRSYSYESGRKSADAHDPELQSRSRRVAELFSEALIILGNEPSLGLYRVQEHVRRSVPTIIDHKKDLSQLQQQVQGVCFDTDYASSVVQQMQTITQFSTIQEHLNRSIGLKQILDERGILEPRVDQPQASAAKAGTAHSTSASHRTSSPQQSSEESSGASTSVQRNTASSEGGALLLPGLSKAGALQAAARRQTFPDDLVPKKFS